MKSYPLAAFAFLASVAPSFAEDGAWRYTAEEQGVTWVTEVTVASGKVLQVMPNGQRQIPDQVIDLGREVTGHTRKSRTSRSTSRRRPWKTGFIHSALCWSTAACA